MLTGRKRFLAMGDNWFFTSRNGVSGQIAPFSKIGTLISLTTPAELGGDKQMALHGGVFKDPFADPATGITYQYRIYAILGNMGGNCCQWRSLALYLTNDGRNLIRPVLNQVEYPCGSGNKANNIVHLGPGLPYKFNGKYYLGYSSFSPCNEPLSYLESADGVTNWTPSTASVESTFDSTHFQDGPHKIIQSPVDGVKRLYTRGWLGMRSPLVEIDPVGADVGRTAIWVPVPSFPANSPWPPAGWSNYEFDNGHGTPDFHNATINGTPDANVVQFPLEWNGVGATGWDVYTHAVTEMSGEVDAEMHPVFLSFNTHYHYQDCRHRATLSYSRDGATFARPSGLILESGTYGVSPDGGYFFVNWGGVRNGEEIIHYYPAAKYGGKPGCPAQSFVAGDQSIQGAKMRLDGYMPNLFSAGNDALTDNWQIPNDGYASILHINAAPTGAGAWLKAQLETTGGAVISGFSFADCTAFIGDHILDGVIAWTTGNLATLAGQTVRVRFQGDKMNFYSAWMAQGAPLVNTPAPQIGSFTADAATIALGSATTLRWTVANAASVSLDQGIGAVTGNAKSVSPATTTTYTLTATGSDGRTATASVTVTVTGAPPSGPYLSAPAKIYAGSTVAVKLLNAGTKIITSMRAWRIVGNIWTRAGAYTIDGDGKGFSFTANAETGSGFIFILSLDGVADALECWFEQIAPPSVAPASLSGKSGQNLSLTFSASAGETIAAVSTSNAGVATATKTGNTITVNLVGAGAANIIITPQVVSGFNNSDFAITVPVSVEAQVSVITGTGVAVLTASAVCDLEI